jgi:hypothetical protein
MNRSATFTTKAKPVATGGFVVRGTAAITG